MIRAKNKMIKAKQKKSLTTMLKEHESEVKGGLKELFFHGIYPDASLNFLKIGKQYRKAICAYSERHAYIDFMPNQCFPFLKLFSSCIYIRGIYPTGSHIHLFHFD